MKLPKIQSKDLIYKNVYGYDRLYSKLILSDTDWMNYILKAIFTTKRYGRFYVSFEFSGIQFSVMKVTLIRKKHFYNFEYEFSTDIFQKYIIQYLSDQIAALDEPFRCYRDNAFFDSTDFTDILCGVIHWVVSDK